MLIKVAAVTALVLSLVVGPAVGVADERAQPVNAAPLPDDPTQVRVRELIYVLRQHRAFARTDEWGGAIRELTKIGQPALPELLLELKQTERGMTMRGLLFTVRAINDPRALAFVFEAIPKAERLSNSGSDYGLAFVDPELHKFMRENANYPRGEDESAGYGRPINELLGTLHKLSGTAPPDLEKGPEPSWTANYWRKWWKDKQDAGTAPAKGKTRERAPRTGEQEKRGGVRK